MKKVWAAAHGALVDAAKLQVPTIAAAVAGVVVPIAASLFGVKLTVTEVTAWLVAMGAVATVLEHL